jgi:hypothetical protein
MAIDKKKIWLGIDPDVNKSGLSFLSSEKVWKLKEAELFDVQIVILETLREFGASISNLEVVVEVPLMDSASFGASALFVAKKQQLKMQGVPEAVAIKRAIGIVCKTAMQKARCGQIGKEIIKILRSLGVESIKQIKPSQRVRMDGFPFNKTSAKELRKLFKTGKKFRYPSKLNNERFKEITGAHKQNANGENKKATNEENRDSALLLVQKYLNL